MNVDHLIEELEARRVQIATSGQDLKLRAERGVITPQLMELISASKPEILAKLRFDNILSGQRWGAPPRETIPLATTKTKLSNHDWTLLRQAISNQHRISGCEGVVRWILGDGGQADRYATVRGWAQGDCLIAATLDLLLWQRASFINGATRQERIEDLLDRLATLEALHINSGGYTPGCTCTPAHPQKTKEISMISTPRGTVHAS